MSSQAEKQGKISFFAAVLLSINIMVGAGILYAVGPMTASAGSTSFFGWPLIGLLVFPIIWCVAQASQLFPGGGGFYHYCKTGINQTAGFIAHWAYILGYLGVAASLMTLLRNALIPMMGIDLIREYPVILNLALVSFYTLINLVSLEKVNRIQSAGTLLKLSPIVLVILLLSFYMNGSIGFNFSELGNIGMTVSTVIFAYTGFEACCSIGSLLRGGPERVGSVILTGFFLTLVIYFLFHVSLIFIMGPENLATYGAIAFPQYLGLSETMTNVAQLAISAIILLIWANSILGLSMANINNMHELTQLKLIPGDTLFSRLNRSLRPKYTVFLHGALLFVIISSITDVDVLFSLSNLGIITAFLLTLVAVFRFNWMKKNFVQVAVTGVAFVSCATLIYYNLIKIPHFVYALPLILGMVVGIALFCVKSRSLISVPVAE